MTSFDDLEPDFVPPAREALPAVVARARALRIRRRLVLAVVGVAVAVGVALPAALASGAGHGSSSRRVEVANPTSTTSEAARSLQVTTTTLAPPSTTSSPTTMPVIVRPQPGTRAPSAPPQFVSPASVAPPGTTATSVAPAGRLVFAFDRSQFAIGSGAQATVGYTVTNDGDGPAVYRRRSARVASCGPTGSRARNPCCGPSRSHRLRTAAPRPTSPSPRTRRADSR